MLILANQGNRWIQGSLAALLAVVAGLDNIFRWKENWVRTAATLEALKMELLKFETRTGIYRATLDDQKALDVFVQQIEQITSTDIRAWRGLYEKQEEERAPLPTAPGS